MGVENWIDEITRMVGTIDDGRGNSVRSYAVFEKTEFPETVTAVPCALTFTEDVRMDYKDGGPNIDTWRGKTELHLALDVKKSHYPAIMRYFARIRAVFAANRTLGGKVSFCKLRMEEPSIEGPVILDYGSPSEHLGLVINWVVQERYS